MDVFFCRSELCSRSCEETVTLVNENQIVLRVECQKKCLTKIPKSLKISKGTNILSPEINHDRLTHIPKINGKFDNAYPFFIIGIHKAESLEIIVKKI